MSSEGPNLFDCGNADPAGAAATSATSSTGVMADSYGIWMGDCYRDLRETVSGLAR